MHHRRPDLILVDLELPDMDGFEVVQSMRSSSNGEQVPIVVISARDGTNTLGTLPGGMSIAKAEGLIPSEVIRWLQNVLDMAMLD